MLQESPMTGFVLKVYIFVLHIRLLTYTDIEAFEKHISVDLSFVHPSVFSAQVFVASFGETAPA